MPKSWENWAAAKRNDRHRSKFGKLEPIPNVYLQILEQKSVHQYLVPGPVVHEGKMTFMNLYSYIVGRIQRRAKSSHLITTQFELPLPLFVCLFSFRC